MITGSPPFYDNKNGITGEVVQQIIELMPGLDDTHRRIDMHMVANLCSEGTQHPDPPTPKWSRREPK